jgi:hypothetical protein
MAGRKKERKKEREKSRTNMDLENSVPNYSTIFISEISNAMS